MTRGTLVLAQTGRQVVALNAVARPKRSTISPTKSGVPGMWNHAKDLPMSMQIVGKYFDEGTVMRVAAAYEDATRWYRTRPSLRETPSPGEVKLSRPATVHPNAPSRAEIEAILKRLGMRNPDAATIDRATELGTIAAELIARLPASLPRDAESAHILSLPLSP